MPTRVRLPNAAAPPDSSRTMTLSDAQPLSQAGGPDLPQIAIPAGGTLRLTGGPRSRPQVTWDEHVVDNENCGKKKSKICCIYHKPRPFDESSSEESSSDPDSDSDSEASDDGRARPSQSRRHRHHHRHPADPNDPSESNFRCRDDADGDVCELKKDTHNAYEAQPSPSMKGKGRVKNK